MICNSLDVLGQAGVGKTALATRACAHMWYHTLKGNESKVIFRSFNCASISTFIEDLNGFYEDLNQTSHIVTIGSTNGWIELRNLYRNMTKLYPSRLKLFILDDVEDIENVGGILNNVCQTMVSNSNDCLWKIIVTTQRHGISSEDYHNIEAENIILIDGLYEEETLALYNSTSIEEDAVMTIRELLGSHPRPLLIYRDLLNSRPVSVSSLLI